MSDLIKREDAIKAVEECLKARPRYTVKTAIEAIPSVDVDISEYSDKLWKNAYERGKADRPQGWIPCSERLPRPYTEVLVCDECGWISLGLYRPCDVTEKDSGWSTLTRIKIPTDGIIAWMPLPEPWKGADDE